MRARSANLAQLAVIGGMAAAGLWAWGQVPDGHQVPVHFSLAGQPDRWQPAGTALSMLPAVALATWGLGQLLVHIDPRRDNLERSAGAVSWVFLCVTLLLAALQGLLVASALGGTAPRPGWGILLLGALLVGVGNVMGKLRHNYTVGVRTPWALADERIWDRTQRLGGRTMVGGGLLLAVLALSLPEDFYASAIVGVTAAIVLLPMLASYRWWRQLNRPSGGGSAPGRG